MDASKHWTGRGEGFQPPAGDDVRKLVEGPPLALLADKQQAWPTVTGKQAGYRFHCYRLDELRRPTFLYDFGDIRIEDFFRGQGEGAERHLVRTVHFIAKEGAQSSANLYHRAAAQMSRIGSATKGEYRLEQNVALRIAKKRGDSSFVRESSGRHELVIPIVFEGGKAKLTISYSW